MNKTKNLPLYYDVQCENGCPIIVDGGFVTVSGLDALASWAMRAILVQRYQLPIYSTNYGCEINSLIGSEYSENFVRSESERLILECVCSNPYITGISHFSTSYIDRKLTINFRLETIYGVIDIEL